MSDIKQADVASSALTFDLHSLASDAALLAGRGSAAVDNSTNLYLDYIVSGKVKMGTTPTVSKVLEIWLWGSLNSTPDYPDQITGSDANISFTTRDILAACCVPLFSVVPTATTGVVWYMKPTGIAQFFGGVVPSRWGLWMVHSMVAALDSTAGSHVFKYSPRYATLT